MARRKSKFLDDDDDSSNDSGNEGRDDPDEQFDPDDLDVAAERELFRNPYQRGKKRARKEDADEGEVGDNGWGERGAGGGGRGRGQGRKTDYTK